MGVIPVDLTITLGCDVILSAWLLRACWACRRCHGKPWASQVRWHDGFLPRTRGDAKWVEESEVVPGHKDHHAGEVTSTETRTTMQQKVVPQPRRRNQPHGYTSSRPCTRLESFLFGDGLTAHLAVLAAGDGEKKKADPPSSGKPTPEGPPRTQKRSRMTSTAKITPRGKKW